MLAPFFLLNFVVALSVVLFHVVLGSSLLLGSLVDSEVPRSWRRRGIMVSAGAYVLGVSALVLGSTLEVPYFAAWLVLTFAFPLLVVCVDWSASLSFVLRGRLARSGIWLILGVAFLVRLPFYLSPVRISSDFTAYSFYVSRMEAGAVPYRDVFIPYTPGFTLLLQGIAWLGLLPGLRALLALPDLLLVVVLGRWPRGDPGRMTRAMAWALFPLAIVEVGWSSHVDGLVALLILASILPLAGRMSTRGAILGFAAAVRPFAIGAAPSVLLGLSSVKRAAVFLVSLVLLVGAFVLYYAAQLTSLLGGAVAYQLSRGSYNSFYFFVNWYASWAVARSPVGPLLPDGSSVLTVAVALTFLAANLAVLAFRARRSWILRGYGLAVSAMYALWGLLLVFFPLTFFGGLAVAPSWPNYRPAAIDVGFGVVLAGFGLVMAREARVRVSDDAEHDRLYLLFLNMAMFVPLIPVYYAWYLLWVAPAVLFLAPRRLMAVALVVLLAAAPISYYASDFNSLGSQLSSQSIPVGEFAVTAIDRPAGGPMPFGSYSVNGSQGDLFLSTAGNLTIVATFSVDPASHPLLTFTIWSDHQSIGWNRERLWVWVMGQSRGGAANTSYVLVADDPNQYVTGRPYVANLLYTGFERVTGMKIRFDNFDPAPHHLWIGDVAAFDEYA